MNILSILLQAEASQGLHQILRDKFVEGNAFFMSLVALALILGLAFCIERIIYLTLAEIDARKFVDDLDRRLSEGDIEGAKDKARNTVGPVASVCYQGLIRMKEPADSIERSMESYANVQLAQLEKGSAWIKLFIAIAPSLGFLGTVIGMVMAFENIETAGDISPTIVAEGMKVALITTIFGIVSAIILQLFYNYILTKIDRLTAQMEESAISLIDSIEKNRK
ncbi:MAG: MotA/TolQ/ExbB proton channel family protein [Prevotellaceae bacterium]|nr:MotA/TolQ/ExbB proton channel family protein [Prevotellaceae bacterium]